MREMAELQEKPHHKTGKGITNEQPSDGSSKKRPGQKELSDRGSVQSHPATQE
jgi:hypothetical protein